MNLAVQHLRKHWLMILFSCLLLLIVFNFNTIAYLLSSDRNIMVNIHADILETRMFFAPAVGTFETGNLIAVSVLLDSTKVPVNAVEGEIVFPTDKLEILSISTKNSINTLWIPTDPHFSPETNTIVFSGGLPTPGFLGIAGNVVTIVFKAKAPGSVELKLVRTGVLANDGKGTKVNVPEQLANFTIETPIAIVYPKEDLNRDGKVDMTDLSILIANWGIPLRPDVDLVIDGVIDVKDFSVLLSKLTFLVP